MYERIVVAVDGSEESNRALDEAVRLAGNQGARLRVVHVVDTSCLYHGDESDRSADLEEAWCKAGQRLVEQGAARAAGTGLAVETAVRCTRKTRVSEQIVEEAVRWQADLIVLGTHGRRGLNRLLLGSVAEAVVRISPVSVLLARTRAGAPLPSRP